MHLKHRRHSHSPATHCKPTNQPTHKHNDLNSNSNRNRNRNSAAIQHQQDRAQRAGRAVLVQQQHLLEFT
jgi:hypothetical protein